MIRTSLIWDCWDQLYQAIAGADFPSHPTTGLPVTVAFGGVQNIDNEMVILPGRSLKDGTSQSWANTGPPSKDDDFTLDVLVWTQVPGCTSFEARDRLRDLTTIIEAALRDPVTGKPSGIQRTPGDGVLWWLVSDIIPAVGPLDTEGFGASARIEVQFRCRI
jgi:hypothetical protein